MISRLLLSMGADLCQTKCTEIKGVFTPVDRLLYSETGIKIITMLLFILGAVCFHTAKFLNGPKLSRASKLSSHWSKFHGAGMTINDSFGKRCKQTLSHTHTHASGWNNNSLRAACCVFFCFCFCSCQYIY